MYIGIRNGENQQKSFFLFFTAQINLEYTTKIYSKKGFHFALEIMPIISVWHIINTYIPRKSACDLCNFPNLPHMLYDLF